MGNGAQKVTDYREERQRGSAEEKEYRARERHSKYIVRVARSAAARERERGGTRLKRGVGETRLARRPRWCGGAPVSVRRSDATEVCLQRSLASTWGQSPELLSLRCISYRARFTSFQAATLRLIDRRDIAPVEF